MNPADLIAEHDGSYRCARFCARRPPLL